MMILKRYLSFVLVLIGFTSFAQVYPGQPAISSDYEGVAAKYAVLKTNADETIAVKFKNNTTSTCLVVLQISKKQGLPEQKTFTIRPLSNLFENIGDVSSFFVSTLLYIDSSVPENQLIRNAKQREKITKSNGLLVSTKVSASDVQTTASVNDKDGAADKTEVDYLGVKGTYRKWKTASGNTGIHYNFENLRTDLVAIVTLRLNGNILRKESVLPGNSFQGNSTESSVSVEVNFKTIDGNTPEPGICDMIFKKLKNKVKDEVTSDADHVKSKMNTGCMCVRG